MSSLKNITAQFRAKTIDKAAFIKAMYEEHSRLFDYVKQLSECNIQSIRVGADGVVIDFRDPGISMLCPPGDTRIPPIEALNFGDYEHDELQLVRRIAEMLGGQQIAFFDIGANAGFYSLALAKYFPGIRGVAFEPVPSTFGNLKTNFELNGINSISAENLGFSDKEGEIAFFAYPSQSAAASMTRNVDGTDFVEVRCRVGRLDDYCATHKWTINLIKCDVEGAELLVFRGGENVLKRDRPVVFCEMLRKWCAKYSYHPNDIIKLFREFGYECHAVRDGRLFECPEVTEKTIETNFIFLNSECHAHIRAALGG